MNKKPLKPCNYPTCPKLTQGRYCEDHVYTRDKPPRNARKMGYDKNWEKRRANFLLNNPLCVECLKNGKYTPANVADHIIPHKGDKRLFYDDNNLQSLCDSCHGAKSAREKGGWDTERGLR